jgi:hypothetical protein
MQYATVSIIDTVSGQNKDTYLAICEYDLQSALSNVDVKKILQFGYIRFNYYKKRMYSMNSCSKYFAVRLKMTDH